MRKYIETGKTRIVKIKKVEYYCDTCGTRLNKDNPRSNWIRSGLGEIDGCKNKQKCNPFYKN